MREILGVGRLGRKTACLDKGLMRSSKTAPVSYGPRCWVQFNLSLFLLSSESIVRSETGKQPHSLLARWAFSIFQGRTSLAFRA